MTRLKPLRVSTHLVRKCLKNNSAGNHVLLAFFMGQFDV